MVRRRGFTLIELLTVIAIIAILAAITFPVFARVKDGAYRSSDISKMNGLRSALQLYRADQGGYPPQLLGYVSTYSGDPEGTDIVPADLTSGFLFPKRLDGIDSLRPAYARFSRRDVVNQAFWPQRDPRPAGSAPLMDLNGDGQINAADDPPQARQRFESVKVQRLDTNTNREIDARFYALSGFDVARVPTSGGGDRWELRYALFWTDYGLGNGNAQDDPRQLGYAEPPESTVVTWNSYFRDYQADGNPARTRRDLVLFLGGGAQPYDSRDVAERSWRIMPR